MTVAVLVDEHCLLRVVQGRYIARRDCTSRKRARFGDICEVHERHVPFYLHLMPTSTVTMAHPRHTGLQQKGEVVRIPHEVWWCSSRTRRDRPSTDGGGGHPSLAQATAGVVAPSERAGAGGSLGTTAVGDRPTGFLIQRANHDAKGPTYAADYTATHVVSRLAA